MKEQMQTKLLELVDLLEQGGDWIVGQLPPLVDEILTFYAALYWARIAFAVLFCVPVFLVGVRWMLTVKPHEYNFTRHTAGCVLTPLSTVILGTTIASTIEPLLMVSLAPRLFLIERIAEIL